MIIFCPRKLQAIFRPVFIAIKHLCFTALTIGFSGQVAHAQSKAASVLPLATNPASGAFLEHHSGIFAVTPISSNDVNLRYVGSETIAKKNESPLAFSDLQMGFVYKNSRRMSLGIGEILPPVSVERKIDDIPIVVLNQVNLVDLKINASVKYGFSFFGGYILNDRLSLGLGAAGRKIEVKAQGSTEGGKIFDGKFVMAMTTVTAGVNYVLVPDRIRLGVSSSVFSSNSFSSSIETPLVSGGADAGIKDSTQTSNQIFGDFSVGIEFTANRLLVIYSDLIWKRADKSQKEFSVVDLKTKQKDIHDTVSYFGGLKYKGLPQQYALVTYSYEPAAVGAGGKGESGLSGFGMKETVLLYSGFGDLVPAWSLGAALQFGDGLETIDSIRGDSRPQKKTKEKIRQDSRQDIWDRLTLTAGVRYRRASLGVDLDGELPAAYSQTKLQFPVSVQMSF